MLYCTLRGRSLILFAAKTIGSEGLSMYALDASVQQFSNFERSSNNRRATHACGEHHRELEILFDFLIQRRLPVMVLDT